jgi:hypothetical protein
MSYVSFRIAFDMLNMTDADKLKLLAILCGIFDIDVIYDEDGILVGTQNSRGVDSIVSALNGAIILRSTNIEEMRMNPELVSTRIKQALRHMVSEMQFPIDLNHPLLPMISIYRPSINIIQQLEELITLNNEATQATYALMSEIPQQ